ncbi:TerC family integral membrane protein [Flavobacterium rivuli WB 3.3-2 = DSM 21788]|uniref:TerC family integral membrane protein n=1 Tax=Flavobacterium rivuli WB 3.3-2 = DSM 21788 TaxID=1121895 RepID=A0A0A2M7Q8_9FLAO|nr:TMEM175 family protein [Flavobacterium rivuli]KGO88657.1 TerC family integral membrane protein [Flavobacterium rivuli WB 3.3-2 = DSM 21788]
MEKETVRMEGFSDAIFAIAITLLVLDLHIPDKDALTSTTAIISYLKGQWPSYLAISISFFSIYIMWVNHHKLFKQIYVRNTGITFANGLILFLVTAVSYPTGLMARFFDTPSANLVVAIYTGLFVLINLSYNLLWYIASRDKTLLRPDITNDAIKKIKLNYLYGLPTYCLAFGLSFNYPTAALIICVVLWVFWALSSGRIHHNENLV